jgi:hypothetical protein
MAALAFLFVIMRAQMVAAERMWLWPPSAQHHPAHTHPHDRGTRRLGGTQANLTNKLNSLEAKLKNLQSHQHTKFCDAGSYGVLDWANGASCVKCPGGKWSPKGSAVDSICTDCTAGRFGLGGSTSSSCSGNCTPGSYSSAKAKHCQACAGGKFQDKSGQSRCTKCPHAYYQPVDNTSTCIACPKGYTGNAQNCIKDFQCFAGNYVTTIMSDPLPRARTCLPCPAGKYSDSPLSKSCTECAEGRFGIGSSNSTACSGICPGE